MVTNVITVTKTGVAGQLAELPQPVRKLYYQGDLPDLLTRPRVAIVGSRRASAYGQQVTGQLAKELAQAGVVIVSGLAYGIDSIAHRATLLAHGQTIAVLPAGLSSVYPRAHANLAAQIVEQGGALISEYPNDHMTIMKHQFIARNRIIASLSDVVVITEAAEKSGSLHTAQFALEQGIEVMAVPGNIYSSTSGGANQLLRTGAAPVTCVQDILDSLGLQPAQQTIYSPNNPLEARIIELLQQQGQANSDTLLGDSKMTVTEFQQTLSLLELHGVVRQASPNTWILQ